MNSLRKRRRFPRLAVPEEARVYDETGRELGVVSQVSGNGMNIEASSPAVASSLPAGRRLRITVVEPGSRATNVVDVIVRACEGKLVGMQFVDLVADEPL
ncbi:MAG TPA: PilZ domain-containing protein [Terriglobales bacterium]|nr:PilZ domain-containing protein [Terriglobales bacterium]